MSFIKEKIFLAGANGMVGSAIKRMLLAKGYGDKIKEGQILSPSRSKLDLANFEKVEKWFFQNQPKVVIIAAAKVGGIMANAKEPADFLLENLKIQNNIIESAFKVGIKKLIFLGSSCIYPKFSNQPIKEENLLNGYLEPTNEGYAIAKIAGIKLCEYLRIQYGFNAISLMPTNLYGPNDNYNIKTSHVMASLIKKFCDAKKNAQDCVTCWGTGSPLREFMHVEDLAKAVIFCLEKWEPELSKETYNDDGGPIYYLNVGTGKEISIKGLAEKISHHTGYNGRIIWNEKIPDGTPRKLLDISRIKSIGWELSIV